MLSRRDVLTTAVAGAGLAVASQVPEPAKAQFGGRTIVDSQVHIWMADSPQRPWPADGIGQAHIPAATLVLRAVGAHGRGWR